jgi:hypothetical protein
MFHALPKLSDRGTGAILNVQVRGILHDTRYSSIYLGPDPRTLARPWPLRRGACPPGSLFFWFSETAENDARVESVQTEIGLPQRAL